MAMETRYKMKIGEEHHILPWLTMSAAMLINICVVGGDGKAGYERRTGEKFKREFVNSERAYGTSSQDLLARISSTKDGGWSQVTEE